MVAMNSIPQQDVANGNGQIEFFRAIPTTFSRLVAKKPVPSMPSGFSPRVTFWPGCVITLFSISILPFQGSFFLDIKESNHQENNEYQHFDESRHFQLFKVDGPGIHEDHFYVEQYKQ